MKKALFNKYWEMLKHDKNDKTHTQEDAAIYYSLFQNVSDKDFVEAIKYILLNYSYFPRVDEMQKAIDIVTSEKNIKPEWKNVKAEPLDTQDKKIAREFYYQFCVTKEEAEKRIKELNLED